MGNNVGNTNTNFHKARQAKDNEFYTQLSDIEDFLEYYGDNDYFKDKTIHLPCDDSTSNFYKYLKDNYDVFGIKEIIATSYDPNGGEITTYKEGKENIENVKETMSYLEEESQNISLKSDMIITNPPFSSIPEYVPFLVKNDVDFIILSSITKISNVCFSDISAKVGSKYYYYGKLALYFLRPDNSLSEVPVMWVTTLKNEDKVIRKISDTKPSGNGPLDLIVNMISPDGAPLYSCSQVPQLKHAIPGKYVLAPMTILTYDFHKDFEFLGFTTYGDNFDTWYTDNTLKKRPYIKNKDGSLKELFVRAVLKIRGR